MIWLPPNMPIGLSAWTGLPDSGDASVNCAYWPFASTRSYAWPAGPEVIPPPAAICDFGRIVTCVSSSIATMLNDGPIWTTIGGPSVSYASTAT